MRFWPFSKSKPAIEEPEPQPPPPLDIEAQDYVQCVLHQSAECPLHVGGVYRVLSTNGGRLQFRQCGRDHDPARFKKVPKSCEHRFPEFIRVQLRAGAEVTDHDCKLHPGRSYQIGSVDDFNRVFFYHQGCNHWHDPKHFVSIEVN